MALALRDEAVDVVKELSTYKVSSGMCWYTWQNLTKQLRSEHSGPNQKNLNVLDGRESRSLTESTWKGLLTRSSIAWPMQFSRPCFRALLWRKFTKISSPGTVNQKWLTIISATPPFNNKLSSIRSAESFCTIEIGRSGRVFDSVRVFIFQFLY